MSSIGTSEGVLIIFLGSLGRDWDFRREECELEHGTPCGGMLGPTLGDRCRGLDRTGLADRGEEGVLSTKLMRSSIVRKEAGA